MEKCINKINKFFNKIFFNIDMSYKNMVIYAILTAIVIAILNIIPFLQGTSFTMQAETFEFWFVLALVVICNSKSPIDATIKTFLYFLISQPLIYLFEVPFNEKGFELFSYYGYWFKWTLLTIPGSYIAYYVRKNNTLSAFILSVATGVLMLYGVWGFITAIDDFPTHLVSGIVCSFFSIYLIFLILKDKKNRIICLISTVLVMLLLYYLDSITSATALSNYIIDDPGKWEIVSSEIDATMSEDNNINVSVNKRGKYKIVIKNENDEYKTLEVVYNTKEFYVNEVKE